ncbi:mastermind-like protein 3 isoform X2 [Pelodiscus sinensis]|uniref:mastermind-like protein 3 isoform X2 n=1 Tax=Pelodiscus sinensis TaxID=13735 RepID=UPI0003C4983D|nr:mastermind-like protein 3 isoform X2 [Pelodiscus sinensis]|eukprot:XP_006124060.1 mastermind-like protein 3 isoform X2 [Pelodiscus sinensis]
MGDFAAPAASANGSSICINNNLNSGLSGAGGAGIGVNSTPHGPPAAAHSNNNTNSGGGIPKHSTVVERLRQRIEGCRRHHINCESRYQQAQAEQLELERRDTVSLYQRTLEQRAKKSGTGGGTSKQQQQSKQQQDAEAATAEQRNHTLIMLQETVKRKLEGARSPLNGEQQNGVCDGSFSPTSKRIRKDVPGIDTISSLPSNLPLPSVSPPHQLDMKPSLPLQNSGTHASGLEDLGKNGGLPEIKLPVNGCSDLEDSFNILQNKELKQEPLDDPTCIDTSETSLSNQNKLFSDINLNDQEWQELIDELANTVPEDDIQDLFNEDFEEKKEPEFHRPAAEIQESPSVKSDPSHSPFAHVPMGSPQVRPSSSGPPFSNVSTASSIPSVSSAPPAPIPAISPANCVVQSPQTPNQAHTPGQTQSRPGNGYLINPASVTVAGSGSGPVAIPSADLSPAEQLKQMAAQQQQRAKLMQQKQQQQHPNQASSWSPVGPPSSPYGGPFTTDKPNSPMMYPQAFNNQNPIVPPMANNPQKTTMNNYLPQNHMNMINQQSNNLGTNSLSKQPNMLTYGNTKPLTHFNAELSQRMTPPIANPSKNPMMPYIQQQQSQQPQMQAQMAHLSEEQKRMLIMKQKGMMNQPMAYATIPSLGQEQHPVGLSRTTGPMQPSVPPSSSNVVTGANTGGPSFLGNQPQAAIMKQMLIEQRAQLHVMEQQKQQFLREQRQQQQQILAEQLQQQSHLPRQHLQQQRNSYPVQQVSQFQGSPQDIAAVRNQAALQSMRTSRMMAQNAGMMAMAPSQNPGTMSTVAAQSEMGMTPYSNTSTSQPGMYNMSTGMSQMLQHANQSSMTMAHSAGQGPRQPTSGQGVGIVSSFGQSILVNSIPQQHQQMKGPVSQVLPRAQAPRLQNMMGTVPQGAQNWQQRGLQGIPGRTSSEIGSFNNGTAYPVQSGQPRLPKQHFPQGINQSVLDTTGTVRALNPAMGRQMLQQLPAQQGTSQARTMVMPAISQGVPTMPGFSQPPTQQMPGGSFAQSSQGQAYERNPAQDISYNYSNDGAGGSFSSITESADLVDSIIKGGPGDEWMQELDELFGNP